MAIEIKHHTQASGTPAGNGEIAKDEWNESHDINMASGRLIGRTTAGDGSAEEIEPKDGLTLSASALTLDKGDAAAIRGRTENKALTADNIASAKAGVALTYASTVTIDWKAGWYRTCTLTGNMLLDEPTNIEVGDTIVLRLVGDSSTERAITWDSIFTGNLPDETVTSTRALLINLFAAASDEIVVSYVVIE